MIKKAAITSLGSCLPVQKITNADLEKTVDTSDQWIRTRTGIKERRRVTEGQNSSDLGTQACRKALEKAQISSDVIDLIICTSLSGDKPCPSTASLIQKKLGLVNAAGFDLAAACAGFSFALATASSFVESGMYKNILVVGTEAISRFINWSDRNTCILFGDGAGAALIQPADDDFGVLANYLATDGTKTDLIEIPAGGSALPASKQTVEAQQHFLQIKGQEVFKFAVRVIPLAIENVLQKTGVSLKEVDLIIPHQANMRIIEAAAKKLSVSLDKFFTNLELLGNTSTASVPLALEQAIEQRRLKKGDLVVIVGFGAGLSWGANLIRWSY